MRSMGEIRRNRTFFRSESVMTPPRVTLSFSVDVATMRSVLSRRADAAREKSTSNSITAVIANESHSITLHRSPRWSLTVRWSGGGRKKNRTNVAIYPIDTRTSWLCASRNERSRRYLRQKDSRVWFSAYDLRTQTIVAHIFPSADSA